MASNTRVYLSSSASLIGKISQTRKPIRPVYTFLGVPYADPPQRFQSPKPLTLWNGEKDATKFGAICPQDTSFLEKAAVPTFFPNNRSEDCLFLNIWTPTTDHKSKLPVMVFIHGGAFVSGCSNFYQGTSLCSFHDVVVLSINYRLGPFGFLSTGDEIVPGNCGLEDQIEALKWVQKYIEAFGGNKDNVTVFGESAGAISVSMLILSPLARGLFHKAISESGTILTGLTQSKSNARRKLFRQLEEKGHKFSSSQELVTFLKTQSTEWMVKNLADSVGAFYGEGCRPIRDGKIVPDNPMELYAKGKYNRVPYILGCNSHEGAMFTIPLLLVLGKELKDKESVDTYLKGVTARMGRQGSRKGLHEALFKEYFEERMNGGEDALQECAVELQGDVSFTAPTAQIAEVHSDMDPAYVYYFDYRPSFSPYPDFVNADHSMDIFYVFGVPFAKVKFPSFDEKDKEISMLWMAYFANFAKTGDPNGPRLPFWQSFSQQKPATLKISTNTHTMGALKPRRVDFWKETVPQILSMSSKY